MITKKSISQKRNLINLPGRPYSLVRKRRIGRGIESTIYSATVQAGRKRREVVEKKFVKQKMDLRGAAIAGKKAWALLKGLGIPVPAFYVILARKADNKSYRVLMQDLSKKYGPLIPINDKRGQPIFFKKLTLHRDKRLLSEIASDLAAIHKSGYTLQYLDLWALYKKSDGTYGRIAVDYGTLREAPDTPAVDSRDITHISAMGNMQSAKKYLGEKEFEFFLAEYNKQASTKVW